MAQKLTAAQAAKAAIDLMEASGDTAEQVLEDHPELRHGGSFLGVSPENKPVTKTRGSGPARLSR